MSLASANAQRLGNISVEAQYITDKMALELGLNNYQRSSILQLNLNYLSGINSYRDIDSRIWKQRNKSMRSVLTSVQWSLFQKAYYFYRPIGWRNGAYVHNIYAKYPRNYGCPDNYGKPGKHHGKPGCRPDKRHGKPGKHYGKPDRGPGRHHDDKGWHGEGGRHHNDRGWNGFGSRR